LFKHLFTALCLGFFLMALSPSANAQTTYTISSGTNGPWSTTANWSGGLVGSGGGNVATSGTGIGTSGSLALNVSETLGQLTNTGTTSFTVTGSGGVFTFDNTGGANNVFGNSDAAISTSGTGFLTVNPNIIFQNTNFDVGSTGAGAITLGTTAASTITAGTSGTLNFRANSTGAITVNSSIGTAGSSIAIANLGTGTNTVTLSGVLGTDVSGVTENAAAGTLVLGSANTFTGGVTLTSGTLQLTNATAAGSGTIAIGNGAVLLNQNAGGYIGNYANALSLSGSVNIFVGTKAPGYAGNILLGGPTVVVNVGGNSVTTHAVVFIGVISDGGAGDGLTETGGTLYLAGANTYTGLTTINSGGTLILGGSNNGGTSQVGATGSLVGSGTILDNGLLDFGRTNTITQGTDFGTINGTGSVNQIGGGIVILSGSNGYSGGTTITTGVLEFGNTNSMPSSGTVTTTAGSTLAAAVGGANQFTTGTSGLGSIGGLLSGTGSTGAPITWVAGAALGIDTTSASGTYTGVIANPGVSVGLNKLGANSLTLTGTNTYSGLTTVTSGTLITAGANTSAGATTVTGGTLLLDSTSNGGLASGVLSGSGGGSIQSALANLSLSNAFLLAANNPTTWGGTNSITLNGAVTENGSRTLTNAITSGTLTIANTLSVEAVDNTALTLTLNGGGNTLISGAIEDYAGGGTNLATTPGTLAINATGGTITLAGTNTFSGLTTIANGTVIITGSNTTAGTTTLTGGTLELASSGNNGGLASGALTLSGGTVQALNAALSLSNTVALTTASTISGTQGITLNGTFSQTASSNLASSISITGGNTLTLANTVNIDAVTGTALTLTLSGSGNTIISGTIEDWSGGSGSSHGALTITNTGTTTLSAANTYGGTTTLIAGTLIAKNNATALGTGALSLGGGTLDLQSNTGLTYGNATTVTAATTIESDVVTNGNAGVTQTLGTLSIGAFQLNIAAGGNVGSGTAGVTFGAVTLTAGPAVFDTAAGTILTLGGLGGNFAITKQDSGILTLSANATRLAAAATTNWTNLNGGRLNVDTLNALDANAGLGALNISSGTLALETGTGGAYHVGNTTITGNATIESNVLGGGAGVTQILAALSIGGQQLNITSGTGVTSGTAGVTFGATTLTGNTIFDTAANTLLTLGGLTDSGTARTITKQDSGVLTLSTAATSLIAGTQINITGGTLNSNIAAALGTLATVNITNGSTFGVGASQTISALTNTDNLSTDSVSIGAFTLTIGSTDNLSSSFSGVISGSSGAVTKAGTGTLTLGGSNTYGGLTTVSTGTLKLGPGGNINSGNNLTTAAAGTLNLNGNNQTIGLLTNGGLVTNSGSATTLTIGAGSTGAGAFSGSMNIVWVEGNTTSTLSGSFNNTGTITDSGTGTGTATITGTIGSGVSSIIQTSTSSPFTASTSPITIGSGGLTVTSTNAAALLTVSSGIAGSSGGNLVYNDNGSGNITDSGSINHNGNITNSGVGSGTTTISGSIGANVGTVTQNSATSTLALTGANTFAGGLFVNTGTVTNNAVTDATFMGSGTTTLGTAAGGTGTLLIGQGATTVYANAITLGGGSAAGVIIDNAVSNTSETLSGNISLNGQSLTLVNNSSTSNSTPLSTTGTISGGGNLILTETGTNGPINVGGALTMTGTIIVNGTASGNILTAGQNATISGSLPGNATLIVNSANGLGGLILSGSTPTGTSPNYGGNVLVQSGILEQASGSTLATGTGALTLGVANSSNNAYLSNFLSSTLTGTWGNSSINLAPGDTGTLSYQALYTGGANNSVVNSPINLNGDTFLIFDNGGNITLNGTITGAGGSLIVQDGTNSWSAVTVHGGSITENGVINNVAGITIVGDVGATSAVTYAFNGLVTMTGTLANLASAAYNPVNFNAGVSGPSAIIQSATGSALTIQTGSLTVNSAGTTITNNEAAGGTALLTVSGGVVGTGNLVLNNNSALASGITISTGTVNMSGTLTNSGSGSGTTLISAAIGSNVSQINQSGSSELVLSGVNTNFAGPVALNSGTLSINSATALGGAGSTSGTGGALTIAAGTTLTSSGVTESTVNAEIWNGDFTYGGANSLTSAANSTVSLGSSAASTRTVTFNSTGSLSIDGIVSNSNGGTTPTTLIKAGSTGTLFLNNSSNSFSNLTVTGGTAESIFVPTATGTLLSPQNAGTPFGTGNITLNGGSLALQFGAFGSNPTFVAITNNIVLTGSGTISAAEAGLKRFGIVSGTISGGGLLTLTAGGANTGYMGVYLTNNDNTYTAGTNLNFVDNTGTSLYMATGTNALGGGTGIGGVVTFVNNNNVAGQGTMQLVLMANQSIAGLETGTASNGIGATNVLGFSTSLSTTPTLTISNTAGGTGDGSVYAGAIGGADSAEAGASGGFTSGSAAGNNINFVKAGTGAQTLSGSNSFTGTTTIKGGTLFLSSTTSSNNIASSTKIVVGDTLADNGAVLDVTGISGGFATPVAQALSGYGTVNGATTVNGSLTPGSGTGGGTLTFASGLTIGNGVALKYGLGSTGDLVAVTGSLTLSGSAVLNFAPAGTLATGTAYDLFTYTGSLTGSSNLATWVIGTGTAPAGTTGETFSTVSLGGGTSAITVTFSGSSSLITPAIAYWTGSLSGTWNTLASGSANFTSDAAGTLNTGTTPGSVTNVKFTANSAGNLNTVLGQDFTINSLEFTGSSSTAATTPVTIGGSNTLTIMAGGTNGNTAGSGIVVDAGSAAHTISSKVALGSSQTWTVNGSPLTVSGNITDSGSSYSLTKSGTGTLVISGSASYSGTTGVNAGTLEVDGSTSGSSAVTVNAATLSGTGTVGGTVALAGSGTLASAGNLTLAQGFSVSGSANALSNGTITGSAAQNVGSTFAVNGTLNGTDTLSAAASLSGTGFVGVTTLNGTDNLSSAGTLTVASLLVNNGGNTISSGTVDATGGTTLNTNSGLAVNGTLEGTVSIGSGATLTGTGTVTAGVTVGAGGVTSPGGTAPGVMTTDLAYNSGATANFNVASSGSAGVPQAQNSHLFYSQMIVTGSAGQVSLGIGTGVTLGAGTNTTTSQAATAAQILGNGTSNSGVTLQLTISSADYATLLANKTTNYEAKAGNTGLDNYFVFNLGSTLSTGRFTALDIDVTGGANVSGTIYYSGANDRFVADGVGNTIGDVYIGTQEFALSYTGMSASNSTIGGNDIVLTAIPEPGTWGMILGGFGMLIGFQKFRKRRDV